MRLTRQAALGIAVGCGLLAAVGAFIWINQQRAATPAKAETIDIPVPIRTIPAQTNLTPAMFQNQALPKDQVPSDVVPSAQAFQGRVSLVELKPGTPVKVGDVGLKSQMGLSFGVPRGYRGLAVSLDVIGSVGDFVKPGDRVDVLAGFEKDDQIVVRTVVQDVLVLAVGDKTEVPIPQQTPTAATGTEQKQPPPSGGTKREQAVTLALTPTQMQLVMVSDMAGDLRLALRATHDGGALPLPTANSWSLVGKVPKEQSAAQAGATPPAGTAMQPAMAPGMYPPPGPGGYGAAPAAPPAPRRPAVEVIRGGQRELVVP